jgi:hypothetical protein
VISTRPSAISGTSSSNSALISSGSRRETMMLGPRVEDETSLMTALTRWEWSYRSPSTCSDFGSSASTRSRSCTSV